jgi:hypothetical protein
MWQRMRNADQLVVEVHFIPLSAAEAGERRQRLRTLLLRGAHRLVQQAGDRNQRAGNSEPTEALHFNLVQN